MSDRHTLLDHAGDNPTTLPLPTAMIMLLGDTLVLPRGYRVTTFQSCGGLALKIKQGCATAATVYLAYDRWYLTRSKQFAFDELCLELADPTCIEQPQETLTAWLQ